MANDKNKEENDETGGGRMLAILLIAAASIAILYLSFESTKDKPAQNQNVTVAISNSRIEFLDKIIIDNNEVKYLRDNDSKICYTSCQ